MSEPPADDDRAADGDRNDTAEDGERTGVAAADEARDRLDALDDSELEGHVTIYEDAHRRLQEGLADLDEG